MPKKTAPKIVATKDALPRAKTEVARALSKLGAATTKPIERVDKSVQKPLQNPVRKKDTKQTRKSHWQANKPKALPKNLQPKVLVVAYSAIPGRDPNYGGTVEIYSDVHLDIKWVLMPHVPLTKQGDKTQEMYFEHVTTEAFSNLFCHGYHRLTGNIYKLTPAMILDSMADRMIWDLAKEARLQHEADERAKADAAQEHSGAS